jgi:hypothetical protein
MTLPQLPGMQVMHALVGCQKRWINSLARLFHSVDMMYSHQCRCHGRRHHTFRWSGFEAFNQIAVLVMDASICIVEAGQEHVPDRILHRDWMAAVLTGTGILHQY